MTESLVWLVLSPLLGAVGGVLNAAVTDNLRLLPTFVKGSRSLPRLLRIGLTGNLSVAALASTLCAWALMGSASRTLQEGDHMLTMLLASVCIGFAAARLATDEVDKRLLHQAVCKASAAPAAPPDTVRAIETADPWVVYTTTTELTPPRLAAWRLGL
jgi:hypothetical protein